MVGWTGMRGVVALAAAMSLPEKLANGDPFPQRNLIIFLTFSVILVTLVLQGLTLPGTDPLAGAGAASAAPTARSAKRAALCCRLRWSVWNRRRPAIVPNSLPSMTICGSTISTACRCCKGKESADAVETAGQYGRSLDLTLELLRCEREAALALRGEGRINDEVLRLLEHEMDLRESELTLQSRPPRRAGSSACRPPGLNF